jgi:hypothetical protein
MKQMSVSDEEEWPLADGVGAHETSDFAESECATDETCGVIAAVTAAVVPIFNASRRVIFSAIETLYSSGTNQPPAFP